MRILIILMVSSEQQLDIVSLGGINNHLISHDPKHASEAIELLTRKIKTVFMKMNK